MGHHGGPRAAAATFHIQRQISAASCASGASRSVPAAWSQRLRSGAPFSQCRSSRFAAEARTSWQLTIETATPSATRSCRRRRRRFNARRCHLLDDVVSDRAMSAASR